MLTWQREVGRLEGVSAAREQCGEGLCYWRSHLSNPSSLLLGPEGPRTLPSASEPGSGGVTTFVPCTFRHCLPKPWWLDPSSTTPLDPTPVKLRQQLGCDVAHCPRGRAASWRSCNPARPRPDLYDHEVPCPAHSTRNVHSVLETGRRKGPLPRGAGRTLRCAQCQWHGYLELCTAVGSGLQRGQCLLSLLKTPFLKPLGKGAGVCQEVLTGHMEKRPEIRPPGDHSVSAGSSQAAWPFSCCQSWETILSVCCTKLVQPRGCG